MAHCIRGEDLKLMINHIMRVRFCDANPEFGDDQFDEVIGRMQLITNQGEDIDQFVTGSGCLKQI